MQSETRLLVADDWTEYALLDSGHGRKLERFGGQVLDRPDPQSFWAPAHPLASWQADARFDGAGTGDDETGSWHVLNPAATDEWAMAWGELRFGVRRAPFRHVGVFPEHSVHWRFATRCIARAGRPVRVLNLFGYTGLMSLACAAAGADVVHLDASPKSNGYGKDNAVLSGLGDRPVRWIMDDAMKFVAREIRRGSRYDAIVLDPPKFGRGPKNETWRLERDLPDLVAALPALMTNRALFVIATVYAVRLSYLALAQTLADVLKERGGLMQTGEMALPQAGSERLLPTAIYARWHAG